MTEEIIRKYKCDCCGRAWIKRFARPCGTSRIEIAGSPGKSLDLCRECTKTAMSTLFFLGDRDLWPTSSEAEERGLK